MTGSEAADDIPAEGKYIYFPNRVSGIYSCLRQYQKTYHIGMRGPKTGRLIIPPCDGEYQEF
jgi:hypothetical protein